MQPTPLLFTGTEQAVTAVDLQAVEQEYDLQLPDDYKAHLLTYNGGWPQQRASFQQPAESTTQPIIRTISDFYPVKYGELTLEDALEDFEGQLHPDLVPFGSETGGDQFVLSVGPEDYSAVYYISHERYKQPTRKQMKQPRQYGTGVSFLAPSFTAYIAGLIAVPAV